MAQYNISVSGNQLVVELIVTGGDFSPNVRTFKNPSIKLTPDSIKFNESGIYKMSLNFNEINEIGGNVPTDLEDATNLITDLIANFNGGDASPEINAALLASENPSDTNPFATESWVLANTPQGDYIGAIVPTSTPTGTGANYWNATQAGTYTNFGGVVVNANSFAFISRDAGGVFSISQTPLDLGEIEDNIKKGGVKDWVVGAYQTGDIVRHKSVLWRATTNISSVEPSVATAWVIYLPFSRPISLVASHPLTFTINLVSNTITTTGSSTNKLITQNGVFSIVAQTVNIGVTPTFFAIIYNTGTSLIRCVNTYSNSTTSLGVDDYVLGYVNNINANIREVYGLNAYTFIDNTGTYTYPVKFQEKDLYNKDFNWRASITYNEKVWVSKAIVDIEFYNIKDNQYVSFYGLGRNYGASNLCYLAFIHFDGTNNIQLFADEFNNSISQTYNASLHSGIKSYYLRRGNSQNQKVTIVCKVTIDWDAIKLGDRMIEANSNILVNNSIVLRKNFKNDLVFNNPTGFVRLSKSEDLNVYYDAPVIPSYEGVSGNGIPKAEYIDCRDWFLKWDELMSNVPDGYTITKETLTTLAPTTVGTLPIYGYSFLPNKLKNGDPSVNSSQTLPRIFLNVSIHGHEKITSFVTYEFIKEMLTNWQSNALLEYLRFNVEFIIIPVANPHGWNVNGGLGDRKNFNGIDLNRNFPAYFVAGTDPSSPTYSGLSALSEVESQAIYNFMQSKINNATVLGIDFHNFHGAPVLDNKDLALVWIASMVSELSGSCSNVLVKKLSKVFKTKSALIPQDEDYFIGVYNNYLGNGLAGTQLRELGCVYGCTFEVAQNFRFNPSFKSFDSDAMTFGLESFTNFIRVFLREFIDEYNRTRFNT